MITRMRRWWPIEGDDKPYWTIFLKDCPEGYHFVNLNPDETLVNTYEIWDELIDYAERYYADYEIVGNTLTDFLRGLQLSYDSYKLVFENVLKNLEYIRFDKRPRPVTGLVAERIAERTLKQGITRKLTGPRITERPTTSMSLSIATMLTRLPRSRPIARTTLLAVEMNRSPILLRRPNRKRKRKRLSLTGSLVRTRLTISRGF